MRRLESVEVQEDHFTEGEPDLEPPEELALSELDDETLLEEELDNDDIAEEDVDDVTLELTLEDLVHQSDTETDEEGEATIPVHLAPELQESLLSAQRADGSAAVSGDGARSGVPTIAGEIDTEDAEDLEVDDLEDAEESLDRILAQRLAGDGDAFEDEGEVEGGEDGSGEIGSLLASTLSRHPAASVAMHRVRSDRTGVSPCREDEFVCVACFLVKTRSQLAATGGGLCRDCAN